MYETGVFLLGKVEKGGKYDSQTIPPPDKLEPEKKKRKSSTHYKPSTRKIERVRIKESESEQDTESDYSSDNHSDDSRYDDDYSDSYDEYSD